MNVYSGYPLIPYTHDRQRFPMEESCRLPVQQDVGCSVERTDRPFAYQNSSIRYYSDFCVHHAPLYNADGGVRLLNANPTGTIINTYA